MSPATNQPAIVTPAAAASLPKPPASRRPRARKVTHTATSHLHDIHGAIQPNTARERRELRRLAFYAGQFPLSAAQKRQNHETALAANARKGKIGNRGTANRRIIQQSKICGYEISLHATKGYRVALTDPKAARAVREAIAAYHQAAAA